MSDIERYDYLNSKEHKTRILTDSYLAFDIPQTRIICIELPEIKLAYRLQYVI